MRVPTVLLRRHGLTLALTAALVWVFVTATLPAVRERNAVRARRAAVESELWRSQEQLLRGSLWLDGAEADPMLRERLLDLRERSPDLPGPREVVPGGAGAPVGGQAQPF